MIQVGTEAPDFELPSSELTPEGKKLYPKALAAAVGLANDFLEGFSKAEVKTLEGLLKRVLHNAQAQATAKG